MILEEQTEQHGENVGGWNLIPTDPAVLSNSWFADISRSNALFNTISPFKMVLKTYYNIASKFV